MNDSKHNPGIAGLFMQFTMLGSLCIFSWLAMMLIHELGHVLAAKLTGGKIHHLVWHPMVFSYTDVHPNPSPLFVVWAGPIVGSLLPLLIMCLHRWRAKNTAYLSEFFAGFCLLANGLYIGLGWMDQVGDTAVMQNHGTPILIMITFGLLGVTTGLYLWHRISRKVGLAKTSHCLLHRKHIWLMATLAGLITIIGFLFGHSQ